MKKIQNLLKGGNVYFVYGDVGSGKTSLALAHKGKKVVFSFDKSYSSLHGHSDVEVFEPDVEDLADFDKFVKLLEENSKGADLIVMDNVSALENTVVDSFTSGLLGKNKDGRAAYGYVQKLFNAITRWALSLECDVLFTAWERRVGESGGFSEPDLNTKAFNMIGGYAKMVSCTRIGFGNIYEVIVNTDGNHLIKNRLAKKITKTAIPSEKYWEAIAYANTERTD